MSLEPSQQPHPIWKSNKTPLPIKLDALPLSVPKIRSPPDHITEVRSPISRSSANSKPSSSSSTPARPGSSASGRPSTSVKITEYGVKRANPDPTTFTTDVNLLLEEYLSPRKLKALTGVEDLNQVRFLELKVDTAECSLGNFGLLVPNLRELKLNNSIIPSIRDLGSSLENLRVLWMGWCSLSELDGIAALSSLEELYLCFNSVRELQALFMLEQLRVLDLEGNAVDDMRQVAFLGFCSHLSALSLAGNPVTKRPDPMRDALTVSTEDGALETQIGLDDDSDSLLDRWKDYNYRKAVHEAIPHLKTLDDRPANEYTTKSRSSSARPQSVRIERSSSEISAGARHSIDSPDSASADGCESECLPLVVSASDVSESEPAEGSEFDADWRFISSILEETSVADSGAADLMLTPATTAFSTPLSTAGGSDRRLLATASRSDGGTRLCTAASYRPTTGYRPGSALRPTSAQKRMQLRSVVSSTSTSAASSSNVLLQSSFPTTPLLTSKSDPASASLRFATALSARPPTSSASTASSVSSRPLEPEEDSASLLTSGEVVCGNPFKALKTRRAAPTSPLAHLSHPLDDARPATAQAIEHLPPRLAELLKSKLPPQLLGPSDSRANGGSGGSLSRSKLDELAVENLDEETQKAIWEARVFIEQHKSTRERIEKARAPQVLKIEPGAEDAEDGEQADEADSAIEKSATNITSASTFASTSTSFSTGTGSGGTRKPRSKSPTLDAATEEAIEAAGEPTSAAATKPKSARAPLPQLDKRAAIRAARQLLAAKQKLASGAASAATFPKNDAAADSPPSSALEPKSSHHHSSTGASVRRRLYKARDEASTDTLLASGMEPEPASARRAGDRPTAHSLHSSYSVEGSASSPQAVSPMSPSSPLPVREHSRAHQQYPQNHQSQQPSSRSEARRLRLAGAAAAGASGSSAVAGAGSPLVPAVAVATLPSMPRFPIAAAIAASSTASTTTHDT